MKPKISVLTSAYNAEPYIGESIESILSQTFKDFELIIVDDCSTDKTLKVIQKYAKKDKRIRVIVNKTNQGVGKNRNILKNNAKGIYIAWQDADDISPKNRLLHQYQYLESHPNAWIVGGYLEFFDETGILSIRKYAENDKDIRKNMFKFSPVSLGASMIRKKYLDEFGDYDPNYVPADDVEMSFRVGSKYEFGNIQEVVLKYRQVPTSYTHTRLKRMELATLKIRLHYAKGYNYKLTLIDYIYNILQFLSVYIIPSDLKIKLFDLIRNKKK